MLQDKRVLVVDDVATVRFYLSRVLGARGAQVETAASGGEFRSLIAQGHSYDLVILDLLLPDADGIELLRELRRLNTETTVVMLTAMGGVKSAAKAIREGADGYFEKQDLIVGGNYDEFVRALEGAMERRAGIVAQKQLEQLRADFYAMITHDLRNPISTALLSLELLMEGGVGPLTPEQREILTIIKDCVEKTLNLINDYLDFSQIEAGYLHLKRAETDLRELVEESARLAAVQAQAKDQALSYELPPEPVVGWVDRERLRQVFDNLLSNAIKYTPKGGRVDISLSTEDGWAVIQISDTGMGIQPDLLPEIFAKYHRLGDRRRRKIQGTGLGLFIVKHLVEAHGGTVDAQSEGVPGKGSTFTIRIPLHPNSVQS